MKVLLHIGQSKTGTSAIQKFLTMNRLELRRRGILYPSPRVHGLTVDLGNHNTLSDALTGRDRYPHLSAQDYFGQFYAEAWRSKAHLMVLSAEHFFGGEPRLWHVKDAEDYLDKYRRKVEALSSFVSPHDVEIFVYLRPQVDWFASSIAQEITFGMIVQDAMSDDDDRAHFEKRKPLLRYCDRLDIWREVIKPSRFEVVPYVRAQLHEQSSVSDFCKRAEIDIAGLRVSPSGIEANSSLSREYLEVKRELNRTTRTATEEFIILKCLRELSRQNVVGTTYRVDAGVAEDLERFVADDNKRLSSEYLAEGVAFPARVAYRGDNQTPLDAETIDRAKSTFEAAIRQPRMRSMALRLRVLAALRKHGRPLHVIVHQIKRFRRYLVVRG